MFILASSDPAVLDNWRAAFDDAKALVEVRSFDVLLQCLGQLRPDAVLFDARLSRSGAARAIDQLLEIRRDVRVIAFGTDGGEDFELALFLAGTRGYCATDVQPDMLRQVVEAVLRGELWIRRALVPKLVDSLTSGDDAVSHGATGRFAILTPREIEIARLVGQGTSNKRIARQLAITERTVKAHLTMIYRKMGTEDRVKLALLVSRRH
jgi:DNA-binding NarL/FixJ family response regulator